MKKTCAFFIGFVLCAAVHAASLTADYLKEDLDAVCTRAGKDGKLLLVSIGREPCTLCQRFYGYLKDGRVTVDTNRFVYVKMDIDNYEHKEYFMSTFDPAGRKLPFVGVMNAAREEVVPCRWGPGAPEDYQKLIDTAQKKVPAVPKK